MRSARFSSRLSGFEQPFPGKLVAVLVVLLTLAWFGALGVRHLAKTDEGRYAEIPREMVVSGDWLTPRLNNLKYFEKPALQYWATAMAFEVFGLHEWSSRLWTGLTGFLGIFLAAFTARRLYGRETGLFAGAVLASSLWYLLMSHVNTLDMALTFFMEGVLCSLLLARSATDQRAARRWMLCCWVAAALAVLSKGLIGIVLPGAVLTLYLAASRDWEMLRRIEPWRGPLVFLLVSAPWFIAVSMANPDFAHFFFIHEHFERFLTKSHHREGPWWYFFPVLLFGVLPWLTLLFPALARAWRSDEAQHTLPGPGGERFAPDRLLLIWSVFIFFFFSLSGSKLPSYILPIFPALAILMARELTRIRGRGVGFHALCIAALSLGGLLVATQAERFARVPDLVEPYAQFGHWLIAATLLWLGGAIIAILMARKGALSGAIMTLAGTGVAAGLIALSGYDALDKQASAHYVAQAMQPYLKPDTALYSVGMYEQTLPFYTGRTMTLVEHRDELDFGLNQEPEKWVATLDDFAVRWRADADAMALMPPDYFDKLRAMNLPMRVILSDRRFVVVVKPDGADAPALPQTKNNPS